MSARGFAAAAAPAPPLASGMWRTTPGPAPSPATITLGSNAERATLIYLPPGLALQAIAVNITSGSAADVRLGVRQDNNGLPGTLLIEAGNAVANAGLLSIPFTFTVPAGLRTGVPLWLACGNYGASTTFAGHLSTSALPDVTTAPLAITWRAAAGQSLGASGPLPASFAANASGSIGVTFAVRAA